MEFTDLPLDIVHTVINEWLSMTALSSLDIACCNSGFRPHYLQAMEKVKLVAAPFKNYSQSLCFINWIAARHVWIFELELCMSQGQQEQEGWRAVRVQSVVLIGDHAPNPAMFQLLLTYKKELCRLELRDCRSDEITNAMLEQVVLHFTDVRLTAFLVSSSIYVRESIDHIMKIVAVHGKRLRYLSLDGIDVTDEDMEVIAKSCNTQSLREFCIDSGRLQCPATLLALCKSNPQLVGLVLSENAEDANPHNILTNAFLATLLHCLPLLQSLEVNSMKLSVDVFPCIMSACPQIVEVKTNWVNLYQSTYNESGPDEDYIELLLTNEILDFPHHLEVLLKGCAKFEKFIISCSEFSPVSAAALELILQLPALHLTGFHGSLDADVGDELLISFLQRFVNLQDLWLYSCAGLDESAFAAIASCPNIKYLLLRDNLHIQDGHVLSILRSCGSVLHHLHLSGCMLVGNATLLQAAVLCPQLRELDVFDTAVDVAGVMDLIHRYPDCAWGTLALSEEVVEKVEGVLTAGDAPHSRLAWTKKLRRQEVEEVVEQEEEG